MENKQLIPRKAFTVIVHDKPFDVYNIEGKEHDGLNDTPKTWWIYFSDRMPEGAIPPADSQEFLPWDVSINRSLWEIKFTQRNTTKEKWNHTNFRSNTCCEMWCNKKLVYEFGTSGGDRGLAYAFAKSQYMMTAMSEHCFNFFEPEKEEGRKICWYGLPATVRIKHNTWEIGIVPDYTAGLNKQEWWEELKRRKTNYTAKDKDDDEMDEEDFKEDMQAEYINWGDAMSDGHIYWFRK